MLGIQVDRLPRRHLDGARVDGLAQGVDGLAHVRAGILSVSVEDVQGDESENVGLSEPRARFQRNIVAELSSSGPKRESNGPRNGPAGPP